jgi:hypothetical protein
MMSVGLAGGHGDSPLPTLPASTDGAVEQTVLDAAAGGAFRV